jgi:hypothetical protein
MRYTYERVLKHVPSHVRDVFTREEELAGIDFSTYAVKVYDNLHACIKVADLGSEDDVAAWLAKTERDQWALQQRVKLAEDGLPRLAVIGNQVGVATARMAWRPFAEADIQLKKPHDKMRTGVRQFVAPSLRWLAEPSMKGRELTTLEMCMRTQISNHNLRLAAFYLAAMVQFEEHGAVDATLILKRLRKL